MSRLKIMTLRLVFILDPISAQKHFVRPKRTSSIILFGASLESTTETLLRWLKPSIASTYER